MTTPTASAPPVDVPDIGVPDIDVDIDLLLDGDADDAAGAPDPAALASGAPVLMTPPQSTQAVFEFDPPVQLDPPLLVDALPPQVTQAVVVDLPGLADH
ncbi:hypothetical protein ACFWJ4_41300 [Kitasatospora sp. NPDC127067]|uniref:hypothetical protein n=1 Tax=Kitasatospora sp. NPDC127067 TaxID=3347126 RepID=UPI0036563DA1